MPVLGKPALQYVVEDCLDAGAEAIYILVPEGDEQVRDHFTPNPTLRTRLEAVGKADLYDTHVAPIDAYSDRIQIIEQPATGDYGTAAAVGYVLPTIDSSYTHVLIQNGDGFILHGETVFGELRAGVHAMLDSASDGLLMGTEVPLEERERYGVLIADTQNPGYLAQIIEKPTADIAPESRLINLGCYLLPTSHLLDALKQTPIDATSGEYYITDAINILASSNALTLHTIRGIFYDCGTPESWLEANNILAARD